MVNESPTEKLIRELREEIERLKNHPGAGPNKSSGAPQMTDEEKHELERQLKETSHNLTHNLIEIRGNL